MVGNEAMSAGTLAPRRPSFLLESARAGSPRSTVRPVRSLPEASRSRFTGSGSENLLDDP
ncbi:MAG: hypothetical protein AMXMBFR83_10940 [Phycisphaerae bacterium]